MARRSPLVCQHLENVSSRFLEEHADIIRAMVGGQHGIYALYRNENLHYVGLATNLRNRLKAHLRNRHKGLWNRFSMYLTINNRHMKELESLVMRIANPKGNKQSGKFALSQNLMSTLKRRWEEQKQAEWLDFSGRDRHPKEQKGAPRARRAGRDVSVLAGFIGRATTLRGKYKGKTYKARVRKNGTIRFGKKVFNSPSMAAAAIVGHPTNGWWFWTYERAPEQWVRLREYRRR